ncbi:MAG: glycosyl hydrolase family 79 C-terminal domain-containing protein [Solirubrobacteraceae bacterium]
MRSRRRKRRWPARIAVAAALAAVIAVALVLVLRGSPRPTRPTPTPSAAIEVTSAGIGPAVPSGFVGLSIELKSLEQYAGSDPAALDPVLLHLIGQIAPAGHPILRFGGDSTDWSWWPVAGMAQPPGIRYTLTPQWMAVAHALAAQLHARLILGVNLEASSTALAQVEGREMVSAIGSQAIEALEIGNEPELYGTFGWYRTAAGQEIPGRPASWNMPAFTTQFTQFAQVLPSVPLAGPASGAPKWLAQLGQFLAAEPRVRLATIHAYPLKHCRKSTVITIGQLLAQSSSQGLVQQLEPYIAAAAHAGVPLRVDEMNAISCGGTRGVSNAFASALWVIDALFRLARAGVGGVNVQTVPDTINEVLGPALVDGHWQMRVHPEFYGMIMFAQAAPAGSRVLTVSTSIPAGIDVWATRAPGGERHVVVIDKRAPGTTTLSLRVAGARGNATLERLLAPSLGATSGVTLAGHGFGAATTTGELPGSPATEVVEPDQGVYTVRVAAGSAAMLTIAGS